MAVDVTSRYRALTPVVAPAADGTARPAIPARLPPTAAPGATPYFHVVVVGETLESLAHRFLGSSQAWWQIADANPSVFPTELVPGSTLVIPTVVDAGRVVRSRSF